MKNAKLLLALLLALMMALSAAAEDAATPDEADANPVVMTVGGEEIRMTDVASYASYLYNYGYTDDPNDYAGALEAYLTDTILPRLKVRELGAESILGEEYETYVQAAADYFDTMIAQQVAFSPDDEGYAEAYQSVVDMYEQLGYTRDKYVSEYIVNMAFSKYIENSEYVIVADEDAKALFDEYVAEDKAYFENNVKMYEIYQNYYNYTPLYRPEGYRGIIHILLEVDSEFCDAYKTAEGDEAKKTAADAMIESVKPQIDDIYARLLAGEAFEALISEYNTDPGMTSPDNLKNGYAVHKDSSTYVQEFTDGSFAPEMTEVGSVSNPVPTNYGVHILYYLRDIPAGAVELTDEIMTSIKDNIIYNNLIKQFELWLSEYETVYTDAYYAYIG